MIYFQETIRTLIALCQNISNHDVLVEKHQLQIKKDVQILQPFVVKR